MQELRGSMHLRHIEQERKMMELNAAHAAEMSMLHADIEASKKEIAELKEADAAKYEEIAELKEADAAQNKEIGELKAEITEMRACIEQINGKTQSEEE